MQITEPSRPLLRRLHEWLSPTDSPRLADLIFVLAGRVPRKDYALELFRQQLARKLLFSVDRFEIRRFSKMSLPVPLDLLKLAQDVPPPQRHYFVLFEGQEVQVNHVPPRPFGTLYEIEFLARWLEANPKIHSLLIISDATHLRRIRLCCRYLLAPSIEIAFLAAPDSPPDSSEAATSDRHPVLSEGEPKSAIHSAPAVLKELLKVLLYWPILRLQRHPSPPIQAR